jgi:FlaA1/EpsC-like NDP-sugar epimerase
MSENPGAPGFSFGTSRRTLSVHYRREGDTSMKFLKKWKDAVAKDLWVVVLDVIAVNLSYYLALLIRFYVNWTLRPVAVDRYLPAFVSFAPFYTVACLLVFMFWRLYGGLWRYAGINDMNRIILANLCTVLIHVAGTMLFFTRMPVTYYLIGGVLQFTFIVIIRFSYRVLLVEKRRLRRGERINTVVVGSGENGRRVVKNLEESEVYRPIKVVGSGYGTMDGIPIVDELKLENVGAVFIADPLISSDEREKIKS